MYICIYMYPSKFLCPHISSGRSCPSIYIYLIQYIEQTTNKLFLICFIYLIGALTLYEDTTHLSIYLLAVSQTTFVR